MKTIIESWTEVVADQAVLKRFWDKVDRRGIDECWPWKAHRNPQGYGLFWVARQLRPASRFAFVIHNPDVPLWKGSHICHRCDNPPCCNPAHLWQDTPGANSLDKIIKGRAPKKLTTLEVAEIRRLAIDWEGARECAKRFNVSANHARLISRGVYWKTL